MSSTPAPESRRRAEIEAKRARLAELKRAREERTSRLQAERAPATSSSAASEEQTPASTTNRRDLDDLVANLVGSSSAAARSPKTSTGTSVATGLPSDSPRKRQSDQVVQQSVSRIGSSDVDDSEGIAAARSRASGREESEEDGPSWRSSGRKRPEMVDIAIDASEPAQAERVYYTKEVQTMAVDVGVGDDEVEAERQRAATSNVGTESHAEISPATEAAIRKKILEEQAASKAEEEDLERQIQEELRVMSPEEVATIFGTQDFSDFVENSTKVVERALTDAYDYMKDYTMVGGGSVEDGARDEMKLARCFYDERLCKGRSITAMDWSVKHPELLVVSYSRSDSIADTSSPDGLVLVWNLHLLDRPEFVFQAQTDVLSVCFSPFHPHLVIGGTYSGQILIWDTRSKRQAAVNGFVGGDAKGAAVSGAATGILPSLKTPLSALTGHTHPVYSLTVVGTQNANHLITASTDGLVCTWMLPDMLARPVDSVQLLNSSHPKTDEVSITSLGFLQQGRVETNAFWVGTEDGGLWMASRFDRAGAKAGLQAQSSQSHAAPVTGLDFHRASSAGTSMNGVDFSDLMLSSSMDWTTRLWRATPGNSSTGSSSNTPTSSSGNRATTVPLLTFDDYNDYVTSVQWHPNHPSLFASCDASGTVHVHDLLRDTERAISQVRIGPEGSVMPVKDGASGSKGAAASASSSYAISENVGLNKLAWEKSTSPRRLACGGTDGRVVVLDVGAGVLGASITGEEWVELGRLVGRATTAASASNTGGNATAGLGAGRFGLGR